MHLVIIMQIMVLGLYVPDLDYIHVGLFKQCFFHGVDLRTLIHCPCILDISVIILCLNIITS